MTNDDDWRLMGQEKYLKGVTLSFQTYRCLRPDWDHDHCEFCSAKFMEADLPDILREGYTTDTSMHFVTDDPPVLGKDPPVIVRLESKHETVVIKSGPAGPLYSVITGDGTFVVRDVTLAQLELNNPQVYERVTSAIAVNHAGLADIRD